MKAIPAFLVTTLTVACVQSSQDPNSPVPVPDPIILAGEVEAGNVTVAELRRQGFSVMPALNGRAAGIVAFCTSQADAMVITDITPAEHQQCRDLRAGDNWGWSAMSTENGAGLYIRRGYADAFVARR